MWKGHIFYRPKANCTSKEKGIIQKVDCVRLLWCSSGWEPAFQSRDQRFNPWVGNISWRRKWQPTPIFLPGRSHGQRSLVGYSPWGCKESDMPEQLHFHFLLSCIGEGNGNPLQRSCLENPRDGGAWWAAIYGVAQSWTWLERLSSSGSSRILLRYSFWLSRSRVELTFCLSNPLPNNVSATVPSSKMLEASEVLMQTLEDILNRRFGFYLSGILRTL